MQKGTSIIRYAVTGVLSILGFFFIYQYINPVLIDFKQQPLFLTGKFFFLPFLEHPGGLSEYLALFISQFFCYKLAGSILLLLLAGVVVFLANLILKKHFSDRASWMLSFIPGLLLICFHANYNANIQTDIVLLVSLLSITLFRKIENTKIYIKSPLALIWAIVLYSLFGGTTLVLFSLLVIAENLPSTKKENYLTIALVLLASLLLPYYTSITSAYLDYRKAIAGIIEFGEKRIVIFQLVSLIFIPLAIFSAPAGKYLSSEIKLKPAIKSVLNFSLPLLLIIVTIGTFKLSFNQNNKNGVLIHYYAKNENWKEVLQVGSKLPLTDRKVLFQINRALYFENRLADHAFYVPQFWGEHGLLLTTYYNSNVLMYCSDLFYDMGHIKGSLHWAYEAQTKYPYSPDVLKRIVLCNLLLGEYPTAEKFLTLLSHSAIQKNWVKKYQKFLYNDKAISNNPYLAVKRKLCPTEDFYSNAQHPQYDLLMLLKQHPENRMAFEYFMIDALLIHDLAKVVTSLKYLEKLGYQKIPTHIEEAILLFKALNNNYAVDLGRYSISTKTQENFVAYSRLLMKYQQNRKEGQAEFEKNFGNTFWYYIQFVSPITTKREFKEK